MDAVEVKLPGGLPVGEAWCRSAWLRPVSGREEEFLLGEGRHLTPAARTTQLIARCLRQLGPVQPVDVETVRRLNVGDRDALLLHIRRLTLGERISCVLSCPKCSKRMDLDLQIGDLLISPYPHCQQIYSTDIGDSENFYRVTFRVPNGEDQEAVAGAALESVEAAADLLIRRCIERVESKDKAILNDLPPIVLRELPMQMADLDPQAEILLDITCPECPAAFIASFDAGDYLCRELAIPEREFYREVHALSFHYHWSEDVVLGLSRRKRRIYLELLADDLAAGGRSA